MRPIPSHHSSDESGPQLPHARLTRDIIGVFFDVYNDLAPGLPEQVYRSAMEIVFNERGFQAESEVKLEVHYHGHHIGSYRADMIVEKRVLLELKAGALRPPGAKAQLINYLRLSGLEVGLLLFFGPDPEFWRVIASRAGNDGQ